MEYSDQVLFSQCACADQTAKIKPVILTQQNVTCWPEGRFHLEMWTSNGINSDVGACCLFLQESRLIDHCLRCFSDPDQVWVCVIHVPRLIWRIDFLVVAASEAVLRSAVVLLRPSRSSDDSDGTPILWPRPRRSWRTDPEHSFVQNAQQPSPLKVRTFVCLYLTTSLDSKSLVMTSI